MTAPARDADLPMFCRRLGIPGLVDIHTHFMPDRMLQAVWRWFDGVRADDGSPAWPIAYREDDATRVRRLRDMHVKAFTALSYPHKPGMAPWLNSWARTFATAHPDSVASATFYPEPEADRYVATALEDGARVFKVHLQVGAFDPRDRLLRPVWRRLAAAGVPVVTHAGSGPLPGPHTGPGPIGEVLDEYPDLVLVIAHMGSAEYREFLQLALRHAHVHLDTTMTFTDFMERLAPYPPDLLPVLAEHPDRIVFGSDFPNIPYPYAHGVQALVRLGLGDDWLRAVCHDNGARLLGLT
ncbi:MAG TPA: amidohydrolase family protein [Egibacteraceae bacterium]|nr:amidohydrolase family protein [Egibacteraceae bacterium]HVM14606.1 amidohydrolase family protein [Egibacteraceae bacterium]HVM21403.1 amidohydrolase family protein [Egibacteraceae bacterium]